MPDPIQRESELSNLAAICYAKNYVAHVIFRIDFSPILKLQQSLEPSFQEAVRSIFPTLEIVQKLKLTTALQVGEKSKSETQPFQEWNLFNKDRTTRVGIGFEYFFIDCSQYHNFEDFKTNLNIVVQAFLKAYTPLDLKRIGLRYINEIVFKEGNPFEWNDLVATPLIYSNERFADTKEDIARCMGQTSFKKEDHLMTFTYGLFNKSEFPNKISRKEFILDYDCYTETVKEEDIMRLSDVFHEDIQLMFERSIHEGLRRIMENGDDN